jgi:hypothetical protein
MARRKLASSRGAHRERLGLRTRVISPIGSHSPALQRRRPIVIGTSTRLFEVVGGPNAAGSNR